MISLRDSPIYRQKSFDESKHPRGEGGKFGEGGGGGAQPEAAKPSKPENKLPRSEGKRADKLARYQRRHFEKTFAKVAERFEFEGPINMPHGLERDRWRHVIDGADQLTQSPSVPLEAKIAAWDGIARRANAELRETKPSKDAEYDHNTEQRRSALRETARLAQDATAHVRQLDKEYRLPIILPPAKAKSVFVWQKSRDASGHEYSASVSGKPANNLPK